MLRAILCQADAADFDLSFMGGTAPVASVVPEPEPAPGGFDFMMGGGSAPVAPVPPAPSEIAPAGGSAFGFISTTEPEPEPEQSSSPNNGGGFSFMPGSFDGTVSPTSVSSIYSTGTDTGGGGAGEEAAAAGAGGFDFVTAGSAPAPSSFGAEGVSPSVPEGAGFSFVGVPAAAATPSRSDAHPFAVELYPRPHRPLRGTILVQAPSAARVK